MVASVSPLWPMTSRADACSYCMGSVVLILSRIYLYLQLLCVRVPLFHREILFSVSLPFDASALPAMTALKQSFVTAFVVNS